MSDRQKTRARPTSRRRFGQSYGSVLAEGISRRALLKGFVATAAVSATARFGGDAAGSTLAFY
jgi:hypothetical protein